MELWLEVLIIDSTEPRHGENAEKHTYINVAAYVNVALLRGY
jgi:hypothetical protein